MARRYWLGKEPIGKRIRVEASAESHWMTIVGVVSDSMQNALETKMHPTLYRPLLQTKRRRTDYKESEAVLREVDQMGLVIRTTRRPENLLNAAEKQERVLEPDQPALQVAEMEDTLTKAVE